MNKVQFSSSLNSVEETRLVSYQSQFVAICFVINPSHGISDSLVMAREVRPLKLSYNQHLRVNAFICRILVSSSGFSRAFTWADEGLVQCSHINIPVIPRASPSLAVIHGSLQLRCCSHRGWEGVLWAVRGLSAPESICRADMESSFVFWKLQGQRPEFSIRAVIAETCGEPCKGTFSNLRKVLVGIDGVSLCNRCFPYAVLFRPRHPCNSMRQVRKVETRQLNPSVPR